MNNTYQCIEMSLKDYDYPFIINMEAICNNCNKKKMCHQCNECFVMTCSLCILKYINMPRLPKCNNCNNLFMECELHESKVLYNNTISIISNNISNYNSNLKIPNINIQMKELNDVCKQLKYNLFILMKELVRDMKNDKSLCKLFIIVNRLYISIKNNNKYTGYCNYLYNNDKYILISKINNLYYTYNIYKRYLQLCTESIYYEINIEKLKDNLPDYITDGEFDYTKSLDDEYINWNGHVYKMIYKTANIINLCTTKDCRKECHMGVRKYLDNKKELSYCIKCNHYNIKFDNYDQVYCIICGNIYDSITLKSESFITNPLCIKDREYALGRGIIIKQFEKYLSKLPKNIVNIIRKNKKNLDKSLRIYTLFVDIIKRHEF